jgi:hypothetical protein
MTDENLYEYITRRERELTAQISAITGQINQLRSQVAQREVELAQVRGIKTATLGSAIGRTFNVPYVPTGGTIETVTGLPPINSNATSRPTYAPVSQAALDLGLYEKMTIKQLVIRALLDHFKAGGNAIAIRDFIQDAYGRDILPSSLRPQLHRLKADGILGQEPSTDTWDFQDGMRSRYAASTLGVMELQDSEPSLRESLETFHDNQKFGDK